MELIVILIVVAALALVAAGVGYARRNKPRPVPPPTRPSTLKAGGASPASTRASTATVPGPDAGADGKAATAADRAGGDGAGGGGDAAGGDEEGDAGDDDRAGTDEAQAAPAQLEALVRPRFRDRLGKARSLLSGYLGSILSRGVDAETWEELEEALIRADVGVETTMSILDELRATAKSEQITESGALLDALKAQLRGRLGGAERSLRLDEATTNVWLFVGVNGVGKTTTIGKVGYQQRLDGRSVLMAAGDTFRAAAAEQLETWAERSQAEFVRGNEGADPSSVVFDGIQRAAARDIDLVLADTAGRLHTKSNLMDELRKVRRVAGREPGNVTEVLLVLDAVTGQNGLVQAAEFTGAVDVTGVVLTKLDGSAKGGIVLAIEDRLGIPVKLVGLGEKIEDLVPFDADEFVEALFA
ncbi:MAG: signal recognition particle-docking protein FtsY [Acidimicrobiia bacterium]|nr:signal recognition particle-docking protein FtsY [Acidimicrobiia bacterium]